jgi:mevalonate kinase
MPVISASALGKVILLGEHAVVYGEPAIAVPVEQVRARVMVSPEPRRPPGQVRLQAPGIGLDSTLEEISPAHPLARAVALVMEELGISRPPAMTIRVTSTIPVAAGLGSGAAVSVALLRALSEFLGHPLSQRRVSELAFEVEKIHHGTPSGVDNTVITYNKPVYFIRGGSHLENRIETVSIGEAFHLVIANTGVPSPTGQIVGEVRRAWEADPDQYNALFHRIGELVDRARECIEQGKTETLGLLMDENHALLGEIGVSSIELDRLVHTARLAGASGAKLSGGGRGGNMIALVNSEAAGRVAEALQAAGAAQTILTAVRAGKA